MKLSSKALVNYADINNFSYANQWEIRSGEPNTLYFQLFDLDQGRAANSANTGLRYIPGVGSSNQPFGVIVTFPSIDDAKTLAISAVQADANDASIWKISLSSTQIPGSGNVLFAVTEGSVTRRFSILNLISVENPNGGGSDGTLPNSFNPIPE